MATILLPLRAWLNRRCFIYPRRMPEGALSRAAIALGTNLGDRQRNLDTAIEALAEFGRILKISSFVDTTPVEYVDQPRFLNGALLLQTGLSPFDLLRTLLGIEQGMGRERANVPAKGPRIVDLDLIFYDEMILKTAELVLPHPAMHERAFVLAPLAEIAPDWRHPVLGLTVVELLGNVST